MLEDSSLNNGSQIPNHSQLNPSQRVSEIAGYKNNYAVNSYLI